MILFDEAAVILDDLIEELPDGIYDKLNGGVNLIEEAKKDDYGDCIMGQYHVDEMGRYIEIFYGSFVELYGDMEQDEFTDELRKTLHHELTHHVENMAGDRTLEKWDDEQDERRKFGTVTGESVVFVDEDGTALAPMALAMFKKLSQGKCENIKAGCCSVQAFSGKFNKNAVSAAGEYGDAMLSVEPQQVRDVILKDYDNILCMTMAQANGLFERYPQFDERIMCLGTSDIKAPLLKRGWTKLAKHMEEEIGYLAEDFCNQED